MDSRGGSWSLVVAAGLMILMAQLDATIVTVALPTIGTDLALLPAASQWVVLGYTVPLIALSLLAGRWIDLVGLRASTFPALIGFGVTSGAAALAPSAATLIGARVLQGACAALLLAAAPTMAVTAVRTEVRGRALAVVSTLAPVGAMAGPALGGVLVDGLGWPAIFAVNLPIVAAVAVLVARGTQRAHPFTWPRAGWLAEAGAFAGVAVALLVALSPQDGGRSRWWLMVVAAVVAAAWWPTRSARDLRRLLSSPPMGAAHAAFVGSYMAVLAVQFLTPFFLRDQLGSTAAVIGLTMVAYPAAAAAMGPIAGWASDRWPARAVASVGLALLVVAMLALAPLDPTWTTRDVALRLGLVGIGFGLFVTPNQALALASAPDHAVGLTSATTNLARFVGLALGPAVATAAWASAGYSPAGMRSGLLLGTALAAAAAVALAMARTAGRDRSDRRSANSQRPHVRTIDEQGGIDS
jgi:MFS family permease